MSNGNCSCGRVLKKYRVDMGRGVKEDVVRCPGGCLDGKNLRKRYPHLDLSDVDWDAAEVVG